MKDAVFQSGLPVAALACAASAQTTLHTTTTLVVVPTLVQTTGKEPVFVDGRGLRLDGQRRPAEGDSGGGDEATVVAGCADADGGSCSWTVCELREPGNNAGFPAWRRAE